jgi:hypothetical protein
MLPSRRILFSLLSMATLTACGAPDLGDTGGGDTATGDTTPAGADLLGTWQSACYGDTRTTLTYTDLGFVGMYDEYLDDTCASAYHHSEWSGTVQVGDTDDAGVTKIDLAFLTFTSVALTEENAAQNNAYAYCGFTDWAEGVEKDVLGADCYGFSIPVGGESLDIYRIDGDALTFGLGAEIAVDPDESSRPTTIDETRVFTRA